MSDKIILVVDDDISIINLIKSFLEDIYNVYITDNAIDAIKKAKEKKTDVLITDVHMPAMSGKELVSKIRKFSPSMKILFISGEISDSVIDHSDVDSNIDYIEKPFNRKQLIEKIENLLNN